MVFDTPLLHLNEAVARKALLLVLFRKRVSVQKGDTCAARLGSGDV